LNKINTWRFGKKRVRIIRNGKRIIHFGI